VINFIGKLFFFASVIFDFLTYFVVTVMLME